MESIRAWRRLSYGGRLVLAGLLCLPVVATASESVAPEEQRRTLALADSLHAAAAVDSAQSLLGMAIRTARAAADSAYLKELVVRRAAQLAAFGRYREAEPLLRDALAFAEARRDTAAVCQVLRWLALAISNQGRLEEAEPLTRRQLALATAIGDTRLQAWAHVARGWYAGDQGRQRAAAAAYREAIAAFRRCGDGRGEAWTLNNLGIALYRSGDVAGARAAYTAAAVRARAGDHAMVEAMATNNLGILEEHWGDPGRAAEAYRRAQVLLGSLGHDAEATRVGLNLVLSLMALGRLPDAAALLDSLARRAAALSDAPLHAEVLFALGNLRHDQGREAAARDLWRQVAADPLDITLRTRVEALVNLADALAESDSLAAALTLLDTQREHLRDQVGSISWRQVERKRGELLARAGQREEGAAVIRRVLSTSSDERASNQRIASLLALAEILRDTAPDSSRTLLERAMDVWEQVRERPRDPQWREARGAAGSRIYTAWARQALATGTPIDDVFDRLQRYKARTLLERMLGPVEELADEGGATSDLVDLATLQRTLDPDDLLLDIALGPTGSVVLAVTRDHVRTLVWPPAAELQRRIGFFRDLHQVPTAASVTKAETDAVTRVGQELGTWLLGDLSEAFAGSRRLIVCPDGTTNRMPWASLRVPRADGETFGLHELEILVAPSATIAARSRQRPPPPAGSVAVLALAADADTAGLPEASSEVAWLEGEFADVVTLADTAAADPLGWPAQTVLHVAAHVQPHDDSPWRSEIILGAGRLTAARVAPLDLASRLVVLAGCESAGGRVLSGEGIQGLTSAFLSAGVPAVVATLWPVDDRTTRDFVRDLYTALADGQTVAASVRKSCDALRNRPATRHPFFWAGYVVVGDGDVTVDLRRRAGSTPSALTAAITVGAALMAVVLARRRRSS